MNKVKTLHRPAQEPGYFFFHMQDSHSLSGGTTATRLQPIECEPGNLHNMGSPNLNTEEPDSILGDSGSPMSKAFPLSTGKRGSQSSEETEKVYLT